jgi:uncharacterized protein (TIGR02246 family)
MNRDLRWMAFFALLGALSCAPSPPVNSDTLAAELTAAEVGAAALVREWAATASEGHWEDLPTLYADDVTWIEQGELRYNGRAAVEEGIASAAASGLSIQTNVENVVATALAPDVAAVRADTDIVFGDAANGGFHFDGMLSAVVVKIDGEWLFLEGHLSAPPRRQEGALRERAERARAELTPEERAARRERFLDRRQQRFQGTQ